MSTIFTNSKNEEGIKNRLKNIEKCIRKGSYIFFGTDGDNMMILSNAYSENKNTDMLHEVIYQSLYNNDTMLLFSGHVRHLNGMLHAHPNYNEEKEVCDE